MFKKLFQKLKKELKQYVDYRVEERLSELIEERLEDAVKEFSFEEDLSPDLEESTENDAPVQSEASPTQNQGEGVTLIDRYEAEHGDVPAARGEELSDTAKVVMAYCQTYEKDEVSPSFREIHKECDISHQFIMSGYNELEDKGWMTRDQASSGFRRPINFQRKLTDKEVVNHTPNPNEEANHDE